MMRLHQLPQLHGYGSSSAGRFAHVASHHTPSRVVLVRPSTCCDAGKRPGSTTGGSPDMRAKGSSSQSTQRRTHSHLEDAPANLGTHLERMITTNIREIDNNSPTGLQELQDIIDEWGSSFNTIHTSAAFAKAGNLQQLHPAAAQPVLDKLAGIWAAVLPDADAQGMANVLWACSKLHYKQPQLWSSTLEACMRQVQQQGAATSQHLANVVYALAAVAGINDHRVPGVAPEDMVTALGQMCSQMHVLVTNPNVDVDAQDVSNTVWGCAKLRIKPSDTALNGMLQAFAGRRMREAATPQALVNTLYAVNELRLRCGWQPQLRDQVWQQLLSEEQMDRIAGCSKPQGVANLLLAVAQLSCAAETASPVISKELADRCAVQLLEGQTAHQMQSWTPRDISDTLRACAMLGLHWPQLYASMSANTTMWLPKASAGSIKQIALACAALQLQDEQLLASLVQWCRQRLDGQQRVSKQRGHNRVSLAAELTSTACVLGRAVVELDMQGLAGDVRALVAPVYQLSAGQLHPSDAGRVWDVHSWLLQHQLLDGQGLAGLLSEQQLAECKAERDAHVGS